MRNTTRAFLVALLTATTFSLAGTTASAASEVCGPLTSGKIDTKGDPQSVTVTAPDGYEITGYCAKAGTQPEYFTLATPVTTLTIAHSSGKDLSHYSYSYSLIVVVPVVPVAPVAPIVPVASPTPVAVVVPVVTPEPTTEATQPATLTTDAPTLSVGTAPVVVEKAPAVEETAPVQTEVPAQVIVSDDTAAPATPVSTVSPTLPATGSSDGGILVVALVLIALGGGTLIAVRRPIN